MDAVNTMENTMGEGINVPDPIPVPDTVAVPDPGPDIVVEIPDPVPDIVNDVIDTSKMDEAIAEAATTTTTSEPAASSLSMFYWFILLLIILNVGYFFFVYQRKDDSQSSEEGLDDIRFCLGDTTTATPEKEQEENSEEVNSDVSSTKEEDQASMPKKRAGRKASLRVTPRKAAPSAKKEVKEDAPTPKRGPGRPRKTAVKGPAKKAKVAASPTSKRKTASPSESENEEEVPKKQKTSVESSEKVYNAGSWSSEEHALFLEALEMYGASAPKKIQEHVGTRNYCQVKGYKQKYMAKKLSSPATDEEVFNSGPWSTEEHALFLEAIDMYGSSAPQKIQKHVGTRSYLQVKAYKKKYLANELPPPVDETESPDDEEDAPADEKAFNTGRWSEKEKELFVEGLKLYGSKQRKVQEHVGTRSYAQVKAYKQWYQERKTPPNKSVKKTPAKRPKRD